MTQDTSISTHKSKGKRPKGKTSPKHAAEKKAASVKKAGVKKAVAKKTGAKKAGAGKHPKKKKAATPSPAARNAAPSVSAPPSAASEKAARSETPGRASLTTDYAALSQYMGDVTNRSQTVIREYFEKRARLGQARADLPIDPLNIGEAFIEMMKGLTADPAHVMSAQYDLWTEFVHLWEATTRRMAGEEVEAVAAPEPGDKRFVHAAWNENQMLDFLKQGYLIGARWLQKTVSEVDGLDPHTRRRAAFYTRQFTDALSPSNFAMTNPEVIDEIVATKGENLLRGLTNLLEDLDRGDGELRVRQADLDYFKVGENVATSPGKVVFQNDILQLIQYAASTETVARRPLLIFPPWINKFYILDLQPENSFIRWAVAQGRTVFVVSWVNPEPHLAASKTFDAYMSEGVFTALDAVEQATGEHDVDAIGYCIGGTLLASSLAHMAQDGDDRIKSATFFTAQTDFSEAGDLSLFVDDDQLAAIDRQMEAAGGVLEGSAMAQTFNMLRSNELIWSVMVDNYLKGKDPKRFDLLYWNSDATRMPRAVHLFYLREFYRDNKLAKGELELNGRRLNLGDVKTPIFLQAGETDHIAPYNSIYKGGRLFGGPVTYMLAGSGHIAGVVNPPHKNKYHHSVNPRLPKTVEAWIAGAEKRPGSWWPYWLEWLNARSSGEVPARTPGDGKLKPIEDAPGSYVKVRS